MAALFQQHALDFQSADLGHAQIADEAFVGARPIGLKKGASRGVGADFCPNSLKQFLEHPENNIVVVDDVNDRTN